MNPQAGENFHSFLESYILSYYFSSMHVNALTAQVYNPNNCLHQIAIWVLNCQCRTWFLRYFLHNSMNCSIVQRVVEHCQSLFVVKQNVECLCALFACKIWKYRIIKKYIARKCWRKQALKASKFVECFNHLSQIKESKDIDRIRKVMSKKRALNWAINKKL